MKNSTVLICLLVLWLFFLSYFQSVEYPYGESFSQYLVNKIMWDYRGFDTVGEELVLLSAGIGAFMILKKVKKK